jgi:hypothetical protein
MYWSGILREHQKSGLSVRQFCDKRKIAEPSFYKWRKTLPQAETTRKARFVPVRQTTV